MKCRDVSCRTVLWYLVFLGCAANYMIRSNINIAIVAMVKEKAKEEIEYPRSECYSHDLSIHDSTNISQATDVVTETQFDWNEHEQSYVLGAFYWSYWTSQTAGASLARIYGAKKVFGFSNLFLCFTTYLVPVLSMWNIWALVSLRIVQGVVGGLCWPSLHDMVARWIPPNERSKFMSAYMGSSIGAAITYPLCGFIIHLLGWQAVYYVTASLGIVWFLAWWFIVHDTPADHPRISHREKSYIQNSLGETVSEEKFATPWLKIFTSVPVWVTTCVSWGCLWGMFTLLTQSPTYFQFVHGLGIRMNGFLSGIPHLCRALVGVSLGYICDLLLKRQICARTTVRKIAGCVCSLLQGIFLLGLALSGCNTRIAIICCTVALACTGAESPGPLATYIDLSPNHASMLFGFSNMVTVVPAFISPVIVGFLTYQNQTVSQWQIVFFIASAMTVVPGILFLLFGTSDIQSWNYSQEPPQEEMQYLKKPSADKKTDFGNVS